MTFSDKRSFFVIQFIELPFKGIDDYVCVPKSWLIIQRSTNGKVVATYPNSEDPIDTRERVRRKEKPDDDWRLYMARIKYKSDDYGDVEKWIASKRNYESGEEKPEIKDTQHETEVNKKLRSASQCSWSSAISDKPQPTLKPYKNPRKPLPRMLIKRPLSQEPYKSNKRLKLNENAKPGAVTDQTIIAEKSIIITENKLIRQNDKMKISSASNGKMNTEQSTQPGVIKENQSVEMSIQSTSPKLIAELQPSPQPTSDQKPSPHPLIDRQPSPKLINEPHPSPKLSTEQPLPILQDYQQPISVADLDEFDEDIDRGSTKTLPNTLEQAPQPELVNEKLTPLVRHEHSHPEPHPRDGSAEQINKFNDSQKPHLHWILTAPRIEVRPPGTVNQPSQYLEHLQLPILPVSSTSNSELRSLECVEKKTFGVAGDHQTTCTRHCSDSTPSTSYHGPNWGMQFEPVAKKQSAAVKKLKSFVDKKPRVISNSKNITTMQYPLSSMMQMQVSLPGNPAVTQTAPSTQTHFQHGQADGSLVNNIGYCNMGEKNINQKVPGFVNTSAEQNFSNLAHQYRPFAAASREHTDSAYLPTQADYLSQFACTQDMINRQTVASTIDQRVYHQNRMMNGGFALPNPINQPVQFLPRNENQYIPVNNAYQQKVIRHDLMRGLSDGAQTTYNPNVQNGLNFQLFDRYSSSQSHQNYEHSQQKQHPPIYQDPFTASSQNDLILKSKRSSYMLMPQNPNDYDPRSFTTSKSASQALFEVQRSCLLQEQGIQGIMNPNFTKYSNMNLAAVPENLTVEPAPSTQEAEVQTMTLSEILHETQSTLIQRNHTYLNPRTKKTMVDQATETDLMIDVNHNIDEIAGSSDSFGESALKLIDSACQTDEWLMEEQGSPYQVTALDSEKTDSEQEIESENELDSEVHKKNLTNVTNVALEDQQEQSKLLAEQDMLDTVGTLLTQMGTNVSITRDLFNFVRSSVLVCAKEYETLLNKVDKFNSIVTQVPIPPPNNEVPEVQQVTQEKPVGDNDNTTGVGDIATLIREQRGNFSLPAEYDPNDTKWTLKYRENKPGLIELIPRTGVYVSKKELKRCIRQSSDCRTLARLLLTEIFSWNALSVCSLTGGKAKAFKSLKIDVRPGLDEHAKMVLLTFVEEHGTKQGWVTSDTPIDLSAIMSSIRTKINEIRAKHDKSLNC